MSVEQYSIKANTQFQLQPECDFTVLEDELHISCAKLKEAVVASHHKITNLEQNISPVTGLQRLNYLNHKNVSLGMKRLK